MSEDRRKSDRTSSNAPGVPRDQAGHEVASVLMFANSENAADSLDFRLKAVSSAKTF